MVSALGLMSILRQLFSRRKISDAAGNPASLRMREIISLMALTLNVPVALITGAIAGGAVFGDHTSPISDTTVMTCSSCDCDVVSHVKTQLPYSLTFAAIAVVIYLVLGFVM